MNYKLLKKVAVFAVAILSFSNSFVALALQFSDVSNTNQSYVAINYLSEKGVLKGYPDGTFQPDKAVNRAESLKIIFEGLGLKIDETLALDNLFSDVDSSAWFAKYVAQAKSSQVINGNPDGTYAPDRTVSRCEFLKIMLNSIGFKKDQWENAQYYADVASTEWYTPFMNYAGKAGLILADASNNLYPAKQLSRAEVADMLYLLLVILNGQDSQFLITQSEAQMAQIELYIAASDVVSAKKSAELAVDMTQQALKNMPDNNVILGAAKIARAYDYLVNSYVSALQKKYDESRDWANQSIQKATEAWEANNDIQSIAKHIKDRANEILTQIEGQ